MQYIKIITVIIIINIIFLASPGLAKAQTGALGISVPVTINGTTTDGEIICAGTNGGSYVPCAAPYDSNMYGVVVTSPDISLESSQTGTTPVATWGNAYVTVSSVNGIIKRVVS